MPRINADLVIALLLMVLCAVFFYETFALQKVYLSIIGAKLWPRVVVIVLFVLSSLYLIQSLRAERGSQVENPMTARDWLKDNRNVIGCFALYGLFLLTLPYLGMLIGGSLFVFAVLTLIGQTSRRAHLIHAIIALGSIGGMWAVFTYALGVILPAGELLPR